MTKDKLEKAQQLDAHIQMLGKLKDKVEKGTFILTVQDQHATVIINPDEEFGEFVREKKKEVLEKLNEKIKKAQEDFSSL